MSSSYQPLIISISPQNIYTAAALGLLVLIILAVISSTKKKQISQSAVNID